MTGHEATGYILGFAISLVLAIIGYLLDGWRQPEDHVGYWIAWGSMYLGGVGMIVALTTLFWTGLTS